MDPPRNGVPQQAIASSAFGLPPSQHGVLFGDRRAVFNMVLGCAWSRPRTSAFLYLATTLAHHGY